LILIKLIFSNVPIGLIAIIFNLVIPIKSKSLATSNKSTSWSSLIIIILAIKLLIFSLVKLRFKVKVNNISDVLIKKLNLVKLEESTSFNLLR
jgi:hypothetical protein